MDVELKFFKFEKGRLLLIAIIFAAFFLRVFNISDPLGGFHANSEGWYMLESSSLAPPSQIGLLRGNIQLTSVYTAILKFFFLVFNESVVVARSISIVAGMLTILLVYIIGKELGSKTGGLVGAGFCAFSPVMIMVAQSILPESLFILLLLSAVYYVLIEESGHNQNHWMLAGLFLGLALSIDLAALFFIPPFILYRYIKMGTLKDKSNAFMGLSALIMFLVLLLPLLIQGKSIVPQSSLYSGLPQNLLSGKVNFALSELIWSYSPFIFYPLVLSVFYYIYKTFLGQIEKKNFHLVFLVFLSFLFFYLFNIDRSFYLAVPFPFAALLLACWISKWKFKPAVIIVVLVMYVGSTFVAVLHLASLKLGRDEIFQIASYVNETSEGTLAVIVLNSQIEKDYGFVLAHYCNNCELYNYEKEATVGKNLDLDYSKKIYFLNNFDEKTSPNPQISLVFKSTFALIWKKKFILLEPVNKNFFSVSKIVQSRVTKNGSKKLKGLKLLWQYPVFLFYKLPETYKLLYEKDHITLSF